MARPLRALRAVLSGRLAVLRETLRTSLWFLPSVMAGGAIGLSFVLVAVDRRVSPDGTPLQAWLYTGGVEGAREVLTVIGSSMITVAGVAFSVTTVALSFASQQLGPRLLRNFMRDRGNQTVLGTFIATFLYSLLVLRTIRAEDPEFVPHIAVTFSVLLAMASVGVLIYFIHHVAQSLQADHVIALVAADLDRTIRRLYPSRIGNEPREPQRHLDDLERELDEKHCDVVAGERCGYIDAVEGDKLIRLAQSHNLLVRLVVKPGHYVFDGLAIAKIYPAGAARKDVFRGVNHSLVIARSRGAQDDVEFAVNQLVEVAARAMSPGIFDPFTAIACVDRLGTAILHLMRRDLPSPLRYDDEGTLRVIAPRADFEGVVDSAFRQIRQYGTRMPAVTIRLLEVIATLTEQAITDEHRRVLEHHAEMIRRAQLRESEERQDRADVERRFDEVATEAGDDATRNLNTR